MLVLKPVLRPQVYLLLEVLYFDMVGQLLGYLLCGKLIHDRYYLKRFLFLLVAGKDAVIRRLELVSRHPLLFLSRLLQVLEELLQLLRTVQTGGSVVEQLPPVLLVHHLHFVRGKEDVSHVESVY